MILTISPKKAFNLIFCRTFKVFHFGFDFRYFAAIFGTLYTNLERIVWYFIWYFIHKFGTNFM